MHTEVIGDWSVHTPDSRQNVGNRVCASIDNLELAKIEGFGAKEEKTAQHIIRYMPMESLLHTRLYSQRGGYGSE